MSDLTVRQLYELLEPLLDEYGDLEVRVSYDSDVVATPIKNKLPEHKGSHIRLCGY